MKPMVRNFIIAIMATAGLFASVLCSAKGADKQDKLTFEQANEKFQKAFQVKNPLWTEPFNVYPDNRLYVNVINKKMYFVPAEGKLRSWEYDNVSGKNDLKKLKSTEGETTFVDWLNQYMGTSEYATLVNDIEIKLEYKNAISSSGLSNTNKIFSLFYNALVGDAEGYICAYVSADKKLVKVRYADYGKIVLNATEFVKVMSGFVDDKEIEGQNAYAFLEKNEVISKAQTPRIAYWNFRDDKYLLLPDLDYKYSPTAQNPSIDKRLKSYDKTIQDNPDKVFYASVDEETKVINELKDLKDFYQVPNRCLSITKAELESYMYKYEEPVPAFNVKLCIIIGAAVILLLAAGVAALMLIKRKKKIQPAPKKEREDKENPKENKENEHHGNPEQPTVEVLNPLLEKLKELAKQQDPRPSDILKAFDEEFKKKTSEKYSGTIKAANAFGKLKNEVGSGKESMEDLTAAVDKAFFAEKTPYSAAFAKRMKDANEDAVKYNNFINLRSEEDVMKSLDDIRKAKKSFPEIATVRREVDKAVESSKDTTKQVSRFLRSADADMFYAFESLVKDAASYKAIAAGLRDINPEERADKYIADLVNDLAKKASASAAEYIDFVAKFKSADQSLDEGLQKSASAAKEKYAKVDGAVDGLVAASGFIAKDEADHWERLAFIFAMAACAKELYVAYGKDQVAKVDKTMETLKADMLKLFISKIFMLVAPNEDKSYEILKTALGSRVPKGVAAFNAMVGREELTHETPEIQDYTEQHLIALMKIRNAEKNDVFYREMWDKYVMDFADKLRANTDKGWLLSNSVQIAFYFSDFLKHMIGGVDVYYCNNYNYMMSKTLLECEADYVEHHIQYSDKFSDFVYSFLKEYGAKDVDVMAGNFRIRM